MQGPHGEQGLPGRDGLDGPQGPEGRQGPQGERGPEGPSGPSGQSGTDGQDGVGVESVSMAADGDLIFRLSDGTEEVVELPDGLLRGSEGNTYNLLQNAGGSGAVDGVQVFDALRAEPRPDVQGLNLHTVEMFGLRSSYTYVHNLARPVAVRYVDREGCEHDVGVTHDGGFNTTTITTIQPMNGHIFFL